MSVCVCMCVCTSTARIYKEMQGVTFERLLSVIMDTEMRPCTSKVRTCAHACMRMCVCVYVAYVYAACVFYVCVYVCMLRMYMPLVFFTFF